MDAQNHSSYTALRIATYHGYSDIALALIAARADLNIQDERGNTALMSAVRKYQYARSEDWNTRYPDIIRALVDAEADLNIQDEYGNTALILAASYGLSDIARMLVTARADVNIQDGSGNTALMSAVQVTNMRGVGTNMRGVGTGTLGTLILYGL